MKTKHFTIAVAAIALIAGCKKESDGGGPPTPANVSNPVRDWCDANLAAAIQSFTVNATTGGSIEGSGGTKVVFQPGAFVNSLGIPAGGTVQVELVEVLDVADMILMNKQTLGNNNGTLQLLKSGGEVKITATQGGSELGITPNGATVMIPGNDPDAAMEVFYGAEDTDGDVVWKSSDSSTVITPDSALSDTTGGQLWFYYTLPSDSLEWINCDYFPPGSTTQFEITVPTGYDPTNTIVWVVVPSLNGVVGCWYYGTAFQAYNLPIGYNAVIVGLAEISGVHYSSFTPITIAAGITPSITFSPTTQAQFELDVQGL